MMWNIAREIDLHYLHISTGKQNYVSLKNEWFNRLSLNLLILVYNIEDIQSFLDKYEQVSMYHVICFRKIDFLKLVQSIDLTPPN